MEKRTIDAFRCLLNKFYLISKILSSGFDCAFATFFKKKFFSLQKGGKFPFGLDKRGFRVYIIKKKRIFLNARKGELCMENFKDLRIVDNFYRTT